MLSEAVLWGWCKSGQHVPRMFGRLVAHSDTGWLRQRIVRGKSEAMGCLPSTLTLIHQSDVQSVRTEIGSSKLTLSASLHHFNRRRTPSPNKKLKSETSSWSDKMSMGSASSCSASSRSQELLARKGLIMRIDAELSKPGSCDMSRKGQMTNASILQTV